MVGLEKLSFGFRSRVRKDPGNRSGHWGKSDAAVRRSVNKHHGNCTGRNPECTTATDRELMGSTAGDAHMRDLGRSPGCYQKMWAHWRGVTEEKQSETLKVTSELYQCLCAKRMASTQETEEKEMRKKGARVF